MAEKTKQQKANERAEILENMEDSERTLYRSRKSYVSILHQWKDFFQDSDGDEVKELLLAIIDYDATGEEPVFKHKLNQRVFNGFIKKSLDQNFDDWCITCFNSRNNGEKGPKAKAIIRRVTELFKAKYHADVYAGIKVAVLLKNIDNLESVLAGASNNEINMLKNDILSYRNQAEKEYKDEHPE